MSYQQEASKIRNRLTIYNKNSVLKELLKYQHIPVKNNQDRITRAPWLCNLLIVWLYQVDQKPTASDITETETHRILNKLWNLQSSAANLERHKSLYLTLRALFIVQFSYQVDKSVHLWRLVRHYYLLLSGNIPSSHLQSFKSETGITLEDFFQLSIWLTSTIAHKDFKGFITYENTVLELTPSFSVETVVSFFTCISIKPTNLGDLVKNKYDDAIKPSSYFQDRILHDKPIFRFDDAIATPNNSFSIEALSRFSYKTIRDSNSPRFKQYYEKSFEKYVQKLALTTFGNLVTENEIQDNYRHHSLSGKIVDGIIISKQKTIFIESKSVEPNPKVLTFTDPQVLEDRLKKTVWPGIIQAFECASIIESNKLFKIHPRENRYAVLITNSSFYVSSGSWIVDNISPELFKKLINKYGEQIDPKNIIIVSLDEYEGIVKLCETTDKSLGDFIDYCAEQDSDQETQKFDVSQHMFSYNRSLTGSTGAPIGSDFIKKYSDKLFEDTQDKISSNQKYWKNKGFLAYDEYAIKSNQLRSRLDLPINSGLIQMARKLGFTI